MKTFTRALLVAALSLPFAASAQSPKAGIPAKQPGADTTKPTDTKTTDTTKPAKLTDAELQIMAHYRGDNVTEIDLGKLAMKRVPSQPVKEYGDMLFKHHSDFDAKLQALVKKTGQLIPQEKPETPAKAEALASTKKRVAELQKLNGAAFEREYLRLMIDNHTMAVAGVDGHVAEAKNPELAQMLRDVKPVLQTHLDRARELQPKTQSSK